jgi:hypothetical protein
MYDGCTHAGPVDRLGGSFVVRITSAVEHIRVAVYWTWQAVLIASAPPVPVNVELVKPTNWNVLSAWAVAAASMIMATSASLGTECFSCPDMGRLI